MSGVQKTEEWVLGLEGTPFFTRTWSPEGAEPTACVVFVHGFSDHITRYDAFFSILASSPHNLRITAFDQRGHGKTAHDPLTSSSTQVSGWKKDGKTVKLEKNSKRKTGGWAKAIPDMEWFVKRESEVAKKMGKKLFLWGFSMGGGQAIGFATRAYPPPSPETISLLSGIIAGGAAVELTDKAPSWQLIPGTIAANIGLGNMLISVKDMSQWISHDTKAIELYHKDPYCEQKGSLRGLGDMINNGSQLCSPGVISKWPKSLPLLLYHGGDDHITDAKATKEFYEKCPAEDKTYELLDGMYHEVHNEEEPTPAKVAQIVADWIKARSGGPVVTTSNTDTPADSTSPTSQAKL